MLDYESHYYFNGRFLEHDDISYLAQVNDQMGQQLFGRTAEALIFQPEQILKQAELILHATTQVWKCNALVSSSGDIQKLILVEKMSK